VTTTQFLNMILNWLQSDPTHVTSAIAVLIAVTHTPDPGTPLGKAYKILEILGLNFLHAKETGVTPETLAEQVATALVHKQALQSQQSQQAATAAKE
jgi:hypothetical protein